MRSLRTSLEQWATLAAVADHGSFAKAAAALHRSQTSVSYALAQLHEALGIPLMRTEGRRSVLTAHGATLLQRARTLLAEARHLEQLATSLRQGWEPQLSIVVEAAYPRAALMQVMRELRRDCGDTDLQLSDAVLSGADQAILDGSADVVVTTRVPSGFLGDFLCDVRFVAVAHPDHPLFAPGHAPGEADLAQHVQVVVRDSGSSRPRDEGWLGAEHRCTVGSMEAALATVVAGLGFAWLPEPLIAPGLQAGELKPLPLAIGTVRTVPLHLVLVKRELAGPAAHAARDCFLRAPPSVNSRTRSV